MIKDFETFVYIFKKKKKKINKLQSVLERFLKT